jgi:hypothetical protein
VDIEGECRPRASSIFKAAIANRGEECDGRAFTLRVIAV